MRKLWLLIGLVFLSGCLVRTYTMEKPRTDLAVQGNQGYLTGTPPAVQQEKKLKDTRIISVMEIELGSHQPKELKKEREGGASSEARVSQSESVSQEVVSPPASSSEKDYQRYTVQKNDTLQKISKKFYGTTKKWKLLYDVNKDILRSPDKVYPGTEIKIPAQ